MGNEESYTSAPTLIANKEQLAKVIQQYVLDSRTGEGTLTYRDTAAMTAQDAAASSTDYLWSLLEAHGLVIGPQAYVSGTLEGWLCFKPNADVFISQHDIVAGEYCVVDDKGYIRSIPPELMLPPNMPVTGGRPSIEQRAMEEDGQGELPLEAGEPPQPDGNAVQEGAPQPAEPKQEEPQGLSPAVAKFF